MYIAKDSNFALFYQLKYLYKIIEVKYFKIHTHTHTHTHIEESSSCLGYVTRTIILSCLNFLVIYIKHLCFYDLENILIKYSLYRSSTYVSCLLYMERQKSSTLLPTHYHVYLTCPPPKKSTLAIFRYISHPHHQDHIGQ